MICTPERRFTNTGAVGMDLGCESAITLWDSEKATEIVNPRFLGKTLKKIKTASKQLGRKRAPNKKKKIKASGRWLKNRVRVSKLQRKVAKQRKDWSHKMAAHIVDGYSLVATEELNIKGMTGQAKKSKRKRQKAGLNRSIIDVSMGKFLTIVDYKLQEAGGFLIWVPTKKIKPSQTCPACNHQRNKELSERIHCCEKCSYTIGRDIATATICLNYLSGLGTSQVNVRGVQASTCVATGGWKQAWAKKRDSSMPPA